ncbi:uncharacterized protein HD556DRAFT_1435278 [Suillus plorans]|uniref:Uncharacterized protein n=1 Tax=Suillus plorans TaxID=116603 RepID=A0A9P7ABN7_9AGAM|nr:uncharacterized protein HD556DRAFT_1435278 [Suillus plorans]KAG1785096.1 hypothetical protein HD556DRAFT_1435278 [Suillus plorans]
MAWDCKFNEEVMLIPYALFLAGDNPMQAEECSHTGLNCNYFCRTCDVGGTKEYKESKAGYNSIFMMSQEIQQQFKTAFKSGTTTKIQNSVSLTGSILSVLVELGKKLRKCIPGSPALPKSEVEAALWKEFEELLKGGHLNNTTNPLLGMDVLDIHIDAPTEILHTILLGVVKYFWGQTVFLLKKAKFLHIFQYWLESINKDGLNVPCSLIGKHFKSLAQVMLFIIHDVIPPMVLNAWTVIGKLIVLVWHTRFMDTETYLVSSIHVLSKRLV